MTGQKSLQIQESALGGVSTEALPEPRAEQPWAELGAWLRRMHALAKSELRPAEPKNVGEYSAH